MATNEPKNDADAVKKQEAEEEKKKREDEEVAKDLQVRKVSPLKKFLSSIRVKFLCVIIFFALLAALAISLTTFYMILDFYQDMDTLAMKERVQNAIIGIQKGGNTLTSRGMTTAMSAFTALKPYYDSHGKQLPDIETGEQLMARALQEDSSADNAMEGLGTRSYSAPIQLIMAWDGEWNERLAFYQACDDDKGLDHCDRIEKKKVFVDYDHGDYRLDEAVKAKIPSFFRNFKNLKPTACDLEQCLGISAEVKLSEGGPFFYLLANASMMNFMFMDFFNPFAPMPTLFNDWHYLVGYNMRLLQQIQANRTGLCVSGFTSAEDLPQFVADELQAKRDGNLVLDPHEYEVGSRTMKQKTDEVTMNQTYYANTKRKVQTTDREYCDPSYDHSGSVSTSYAYVAYYGYDLSIGNLSKDNVYMIRFDYHDPLTAKLFPRVTIFISVLVIVWLLCIVGMIIFFNHVFLVPLDRMRNLRADFIKTILKGLDDDGALAQEVFGDMLDDSALIEANGDEISVMRTLQNRVNALYSRVIQNRQYDLNRIRNHSLRDYNALKLMSFFLRRDDANLRSILPGLLTANEMDRRYRRTNITDHADKGEGQEIVSCRHAFRSLKAILSNNFASEFFKAYCIQRGRSSVNSFFFLMDVSWLNQVEGAVRNETEDFLSSVFAESVPQSPSSVSPLSSPRPAGMDANDGMKLSSDLLVSMEQSMSELMPENTEPENRPHRSHFAKSKDADAPAAGDDANRKKIPTVPTLALGGQDSRNSSTESLSSPRSSPLGSPKPQRNQFLSKNGEVIAKFIHERYFGRKSLAQSDTKHAALLGCSQIPDYLTYRDKSSVTYSPTMYNNLVTAITKKFASDVIPQFMNSSTFQLMACCLKLSGFFEKAQKTENNPKNLLLVQQPEHGTAKENVSGVGLDNPIVHSVWLVCKSNKKDVKSPVVATTAAAADDDDDDDDDDTSSGDDDDDDDDKDKKDASDSDDDDSDE